jgi:hypothetical protein
MCAKSKKPKLFVELIPSTCHFSNVRTTVKPAEWDKIRFISYEAANNKCEICGETGKQQGYKHNVECHEIWDYDDENHIQTLVGLIALCPICHQVKHIGRSIAIGIEQQCYKQLAKVNNWTNEQIQQHIKDSFELHKQRSKFQWKLDLSLLTKKPYEIKLKETKDRIFEVKKFKKKKKKSSTTTTKTKKKIHPKAKIAAALKPTTKKVQKRPPKA